LEAALTVEEIIDEPVKIRTLHPLQTAGPGYMLK
jgi:hypothetical protein